MRRLIHISDLHFGRIRPALVQSLGHEISQIRPDLLVVSGDLTQRARPEQFQDACHFLESLPCPKLVVPGNHDIPLWNVFLRFMDPMKRYRHFISDDLMPLYEDDEISVQGITTAHNRTIAGGKFRSQDLERIISHWESQPPQILKILVSHHPLELLTSNDRIRRLGHRILHPDDIDVTHQADLILSGHFHQGGAFPTEQVFLDSHRSVVAIQAGTAVSSRLRAESNSYNLIETSAGEVHFEKRVWDEKTGQFFTETEKKFFLKNQNWKTRSVQSKFL